MTRRRWLRVPGRAVASGPGGEERSDPRGAIRAAVAIAGADAVRVVLTGDRGPADRILAGLGTVPPPEAELRVAARPGLVAVDATGAGERSLRRLARALPWRRPLDGIGCIMRRAGDGDDQGVERAARLARKLRTRAALHLVAPGEHDRPVFVSCRDAAPVEARALARALRERLVRDWLHAGPSSGSARPTPDPDGTMDARLEAAVERARSCPRELALSALAWGGRGLGASVESAWDRTVPGERARRWSWLGAAALAAGVAFAVLGGFAQAKRAAEVERALAVVAPVLRHAPTDPGMYAGESRARRYARAARALAQAAAPSASLPFAAFHPAAESLRVLAARTVRDAVVRPARELFRERIGGELGAGRDPDEWLDRAGGVLAGSPEPGPHTDAALLAAAYGGSEARWRQALAGVAPGEQVAAASRGDEGTQGFVATVAAWAQDRYGHGTLLEAARRVRSAGGWRARMVALQGFASALRTDVARRLASDRADPELDRILARARGLLGEPVVERARAEAGRARAHARAELDAVRIPGGVPLAELGPGGVLGLGHDARKLLSRYESLAGEDLLSPPGTGGASLARFSARGSLASLERINRSLAEARFAESVHTELEVEIETAALEEAARRIEASAQLPLAAGERDAIQAIERLAHARGAHSIAERVAAVLTRLDEARGRAALRAIEADDPLGVAFDADTDRRAVLDRVQAGIERLDALYREAPFAAGFRWQELGRALRGYRNADRSSVLTRMADRAREFARRGSDACRHERARIEGGRPPASYPDRAFAAFARRLEAVCTEAAGRAEADANAALRTFHREHLAWRWPYSDRPGAPAVPRSTLAELLRRAERREQEALASDLVPLVAPWRLNRHGEPVLELALKWRTAPERERNAEHLVEYRLEGMRALANGSREWRYGDPLHARLRLAKDSPLRFAAGAAEVSVPIDSEGWVARLVAGAPAAALTIEAPATGADGAAEWLRVSAEVALTRRPGDAGRPGLRGARNGPVQTSRTAGGDVP